MKKQISAPPLQDEKVISSFGIQRRNMLKFFGASAAVVALGTACTKDGITTVFNPGGGPPVDTGVQLGTGDLLVLNFAFALEQLEAAFYQQIVGAANFNTIFTSADERAYMTDIRDHEVIHREFFKAAIPAANRIKDLTPDFSTINFTTRAGVLAQAKAFEDTGVSAYNGAGKYLSTGATGLGYLTVAGKIVSVEARHAALIRNLITPGSFADGLDANALDISLAPSKVLDIANVYLAAGSKISYNGVPTT